MLLNCLKCCKSISSLAATCPYCMMEVSGMVREVRAAEVPKLPKFAFFMKRSAYRARKTAESLGEKIPRAIHPGLSKSLPNVTQIVHGANTMNHGTR